MNNSHPHRQIMLCALSVTLSCLLSAAGAAPCLAAELLTDDFSSADNAWQPIHLQGDGGGSHSVANGKMTVRAPDDGMYGVVHSASISGHFDIEAVFVADQHVGLALIQEKNGQPDTDNYTMLCVDTNSDGVVVVRVQDRQNGHDNVRDNTGELARRQNRRRRRRAANTDPYEHVLTGEQYSVPFDKTNKRIRIFRDDAAGFFHFYYAVKKNIRGEEAEGWMELAPSKDWAAPGANYFVALVAHSDGEAIFDGVKALQKPGGDRDDTQTGFKATRREYNWSGFFGDAVVVTFGDEFEYSGRDIKCVFWSEMNYVPAWHLNNQLLFTYEFLETWGGGNRGCHEPMSDRLGRWTGVEILEDNDVRKVVHWHYVLCNPDYLVPDNHLGSQLPEADEYWTFYPDGSGIRHIVYTPKLDTDFRAPHEVAELIAIAGSSSNANEYFAAPALTLANLDGQVQQAHPGPKFDYGSPVDQWKQMVMAVHFNNEPDVFCAFSIDTDTPEAYSGYGLEYEIAWQNVNGRLSHWPVGKRAFTGDNGNGGTWDAEVSHACLLSCGVRKGIEWEDHFQTDQRGRKFRQWASLIGISDPGNVEQSVAKTRSWVHPGQIIMLDDSSRFVKNDYYAKALVFENSEANQSCRFTIDPAAQDSVLINPVLRIENWGRNSAVKLMINNELVPPAQYRTHLDADGNLWLWIHATIKTKTTIGIEQV